MLQAALQSDSSHRIQRARVTNPTGLWVTLRHGDHGLAQQPVLLVFQRLHMCSKLQDGLQVLLALQQLQVSLRSAEHRAASCLHDLKPQHGFNPVCNAVLAVVRHYVPRQQGQQVRLTWQKLGPWAPASDCGEGSQGGTRAPAPAMRSSGCAWCWGRGAARPASRRNAAAAGLL